MEKPESNLIPKTKEATNEAKQAFIDSKTKELLNDRS
jgi:hypothetical protein